MANSVKIIGIDPGSRIAGYGVVELGLGEPVYLDHGVFKLPLDVPFEGRLLSLKQQLQRVLETYKPTVGVVEKIFLGKNADSAFKLGHARGICLVELAQHGAEVVEYATRQVKKGVTGHGGATKEQVGMLVMASLRVQNGKGLSEDATDALAMAYYHAITMQVQSRIRGRLKERGI